MDMRKGAIFSFLILLLDGGCCQQDVECLKQFKRSVQDPQGFLDNWKFDSTSNLCTFNGVTCLHLNDSKVYTLSVPGGGLTGTFPSGLNSCTSLTALDISENGFTGPIPDICKMLPYLVTLDVHQNSIGGMIPYSFDNCTYLNNLDLSHNKLTGSIPGEIGLLSRLVKFDVSFNDLTGAIPYTFRNISASSFQGNPKLCGSPLQSSCSAKKKSKSNTALVAGVAVGGVAALVLVAAAFLWFLPVRVRPLKGAASRDENKWAKRIKAPHSVPVSMFEKQLAKLKLTDLMAATNDFSPDNVIGSGRTGGVYKASLPDGSVMAIKRLKLSSQADKQFRAEMETLGKLRHRNLVPLLGYCVADSERLLVYKYMPNGSLKDWLHGNEAFSLDWPKRLKIAIGAARGLAWLHHSCNPRIVHRNISASSLLLDEDFEARITDFGLARLMNPVDTHISTFINGDFGDVGYVAPEYVRTLVATVRGDIYSFGVVLLELITGQKPVDVITDDGFKGSLAEWVVIHSRNGNAREVIQQSLNGPDVDGELMQFLKIAVSCVSATPKERPSSYEIYQLLRAIGQKYQFSDQNDDLPLVESVNIDCADELIVAR